MKKIIAAAMSILLGAFGFTITDKKTEERFDDLEASVSSMQEEISSLHAREPATEPESTITDPDVGTDTSDSFWDDFTNGDNSYTTNSPSTGVFEDAVLPNVIGLSLEEAFAKLKAAGFQNISFGGIGETVASQYPFAGEAYPTNITITIYLGD